MLQITDVSSIMFQFRYFRDKGFNVSVINLIVTKYSININIRKVYNGVEDGQIK